MRILFIMAFLLQFVQCIGQQPSYDTWTNRIDSLRLQNKLTVKHYQSKTFVGSLAGYYLADSLLFINTLTDAEEAGTETQYYIKDGSIIKVMISAARFESSEEWMEYYSNHIRNINCFGCHSKPKCEQTEIIFSTPVSVKYYGKTKQNSNSQQDTQYLIDQIEKNYKGLLTLLEEL